MKIIKYLLNFPIDMHIGVYEFIFMTNEVLLSKTISFLRFPLTVGIVFVHFRMDRGIIVDGSVYGLDNPNWYFYIVNFFSLTLSRVAVPLFFIISGFLFFYKKKFDLSLYRNKVKSRIVTLIVPYFLWNIIAIVWKLIYLLPGASYIYEPLVIRLTPLRIFNTFFCCSRFGGIFVSAKHADCPVTFGSYPIDVPLWYLRNLILMVIISPIIYWLIRHWGKFFVGVLFVAWFFVTQKENHVDYLVTAMFFFSFGAYFSINKINFVSLFRRFWLLPYVYIIITMIDVLTKGMECNRHIHTIGVLIGIVSFVCIAARFVESDKGKFNQTLAGSSFFVFAFHFLFLRDLGKLIFKVSGMTGNNPYSMLCMYFGVVVLTISICLVLYCLLKRYMPSVCKVLTGGR